MEQQTQQAAIRFYGAQWCGDCRRAKAYLDSVHVAYQYLDLESDEALVAEAIEISGQKHIPVVVFPDNTFLVEPSNLDLKNKLTALQLLP